jgi:hypothetical protein
MTTLDLTADTIDVRDIIARFMELEELQEQGEYTETPDCELQTLTAILAELKGEGGDEQWRGDWYPMLLIRESYFTNYAREMLEDCGTIPRDLPSWVIIDWEATADNVQVDYTPVEIDGITYWYR